MVNFDAKYLFFDVSVLSKDNIHNKIISTLPIANIYHALLSSHQIWKMIQIHKYNSSLRYIYVPKCLSFFTMFCFKPSIRNTFHCCSFYWSWRERSPIFSNFNLFLYMYVSLLHSPITCYNRNKTPMRTSRIATRSRPWRNRLRLEKIGDFFVQLPFINFGSRWPTCERFIYRYSLSFWDLRPSGF